MRQFLLRARITKALYSSVVLGLMRVLELSDPGSGEKLTHTFKKFIFSTKSFRVEINEHLNKINFPNLILKI